jgi:hypothetical protein
MDPAKRQRIAYELVALGYARVVGEKDSGEPLFELTPEGEAALAAVDDEAGRS